MVKNIGISFILLSSVFAQDAYERNCVACHKTLPATLQEMFKRYLLVYSGETNMKAGIKHYLLYPSRDISTMSDLFIDTYPIKEKTTLSNEELEDAINIYWDKYKVFNKLK